MLSTIFETDLRLNQPPVVSVAMNTHVTGALTLNRIVLFNTSLQVGVQNLCQSYAV